MAFCPDACRKDRATSRRDFLLTPELKDSFRFGGVSKLWSHGGAALPNPDNAVAPGAAFSLPLPAWPLLRLNLRFTLEGVALGWGPPPSPDTNGHSYIATVVAGPAQLCSNWTYSVPMQLYRRCRCNHQHSAVRLALCSPRWHRGHARRPPAVAPFIPSLLGISGDGDVTPTRSLLVHDLIFHSAILY